MKHVKRLLAILLSLSLCMALLVPAFATDEPDPNAPIITQHLPTGKVYTRTGLDLKLSVRAKLPEGVEGTLSYAWWYKYEYGWVQVTSATDENLVLPMTTDMLGYFGALTMLTVRVYVTNTYIDEEDNEQKASAISETEVRLSSGIDRAFVMWKGLGDLLYFIGPFAIPYLLFGSLALLVELPIFNILAYVDTFIRRK